MKALKNVFFMVAVLCVAATVEGTIVFNAENTYDENAGNAKLPAVAGAYSADVSGVDLINDGQTTFLSEDQSQTPFFGAETLENVMLDARSNYIAAGKDLSVRSAIQ